MRRALHPWNTGFVWSDHTGDREAISAEQARAVRRARVLRARGGVSTRRRWPASTPSSPSGDDEAARFLEGVPDGRFGVTGLDSQIVAPHAVTRSEFARAVRRATRSSPGLARDLVGPDVRLYWDQSVYKQPNGAEPVLWHQDNGYTYVEPQAYLTCWVAITDATPENGCIAVMPGVHRDGTLAHRSTPVGEECWGDWSGAVEVPVRAGQHRRVHVADPARDEAQHARTRCARRTSCSTRPTARSAHFGDPASGPPTDRGASATTSAASGSCATASPGRAGERLMADGRIDALFRYPVKSMLGEEVDADRRSANRGSSATARTRSSTRRRARSRARRTRAAGVSCSSATPRSSPNRDGAEPPPGPRSRCPTATRSTATTPRVARRVVAQRSAARSGSSPRPPEGAVLRAVPPARRGRPRSTEDDTVTDEPFALVAPGHLLRRRAAARGHDRVAGPASASSRPTSTLLAATLPAERRRRTSTARTASSRTTGSAVTRRSAPRWRRRCSSPRRAA